MPAWDISNSNEFDKLQLLVAIDLGPGLRIPLRIYMSGLMFSFKCVSRKKKKKEDLLAFPVIWSYKIWFTFSQLQSADTLTHGCICNLLSVYSGRFIPLQTFS